MAGASPVMLPVTAQVPLTGSYSSALTMAPPMVPPASSTFPFGSSVAVWP